MSLADWPQWRGPQRNGVALENVALPEELNDDTAPKLIWESDEVPSDHYGGHGSLAIANGRVYLSVVWHADEPTETRQISGDVLSQLGNRGTKGIPTEVVADMEEQRMNLSRRLRGQALDDFASKWVEENLDKKTQMRLGSWVIGRFKQGKAAIPLSDFVVLEKNAKQIFENQEAMEEWVKEQQFDPSIEKRIIDSVPNTRKIATDVILCLDAETGKEIWKHEVPGSPSGRTSSSTPAVHEGNVFAALSESLYCVGSETGKPIWTASVNKKGPASSPLVVGDRVFLQDDQLTAYDVGTGEIVWENKDVKGANASPGIWNAVVVCNSNNELIGVSAATGETLWKIAGGGDGTPVISGDALVVSSKTEGKNLIAYDLIPDKSPSEKWSVEFLARRYGSSPIIYQENVYYLGSERHQCLDLETGKTMWERQLQSAISSPILVDGKLFVYENKGGFLAAIKATPEDYRSLGRTKVGALFCASPAIVGKKVFLRTEGSVRCYEFP